MENLDIDKFLDNDYDTIAKPDYSSLSLEERASRGDADAQNELGTAYMQGYGVQLDYKKGLHWFIEAAAQGHTGAFANLGICFLTGLGIPKNYKNAFKLLKKSAERGYALAQYNLGVMYENALGVEEDYEMALYWYALAAKQNYVRQRRTKEVSGGVFILYAGSKAKPADRAIQCRRVLLQRFRREQRYLPCRKVPATCCGRRQPRRHNRPANDFQKVTIQNIKNVPETTGTFFVKSIKRYRTNITATVIRLPLIYARNDIVRCAEYTLLKK